MKENIYSLATANILDQSTLKPALTWRIKEHVEFSESSGFSGVEVWPQGPIRMQIDMNRISEKEKKGITSVHQAASFGFRKAFPSKRELQKAVFLPETNASLYHLEKLNKVLKREIPAVLFSGLPKGYMEISSYKERGIQTSPELCSEIGAQNASEFLEAVMEMGYTNVVIDTHHIRHPNVYTGEENPLRNWQESFQVLLPKVNEIHVGLGRADFGKLDPKIVKEELFDFLEGGSRNTEVIRMLRSVSETGWRGLVVLELRPSAIKDALGQKGFQLSRDNYKTSVERMRNTLYSIFDR